MTWLAPKLDKRIDIVKPIQIPTSFGGFERDYEILVTIWAGLETVSPLRYIRGVQVDENVTHKITIRKIAVKPLENLDGEATINPVKMNYFIFLRQSSETKGRRFSIRNILNIGEKDEYYQLLVEELEEEGI